MAPTITTLELVFIFLSIHKYTSTTTNQQPVQLNIVNNHNFPPSGLYTPNSRIRPSASLPYLAVILITLSNGVNLNPGPKTTDTLYPRGTCDQPVTWEDRGIIHCI